MELIIALILFVALAATWLVLPGTSSTATHQVHQETLVEPSAALQQLT